MKIKIRLQGVDITLVKLYARKEYFMERSFELKETIYSLGKEIAGNNENTSDIVESSSCVQYSFNQESYNILSLYFILFINFIM